MGEEKRTGKIRIEKAVNISKHPERLFDIVDKRSEYEQGCEKGRQAERKIMRKAIDAIRSVNSRRPKNKGQLLVEMALDDIESMTKLKTEKDLEGKRGNR